MDDGGLMWFAQVGHAQEFFYRAMNASPLNGTQHDKDKTMPNINSMMPSKYLKKEDFPQPALVTIRSFTHENVAPQGQAEEKKWIIHFHEFENGMVMNSTNLQLCAQALGSEETEEWMGQQIVVFNDPNVSFGGKLTGGLRVRQVRRRPAAPAPAARRAPPPAPADDAPMADYDDQDIPVASSCMGHDMITPIARRMRRYGGDI